MAAPVFLLSSFVYFERQGVSDVQTIIDDIGQQVLNHASPAWTNPSAGLYKSPVDAVGRFFDVLLTRVTQYKLEWRVRDYLANTICTRRINLPSANLWVVHLWFGENHLEVGVECGSAAPEFLTAGLLDCSPDAQNSHTHNVYGHGSRTSADVADGYATVIYAVMWDNNAGGAVNTVRLQTFSPQSYGQAAVVTMNGARIYREAAYFALATGETSNYKIAGRRYQTLICDANLPHFSRVTVPIDIGVSGTFMVTGQASAGGQRLCMRIA
jgi:hypothetical protein